MKTKAEIIGEQIIKDYIKAFNERNTLKMADLFNFPHVRFANDSVSVITKSEYLKNQDKVTYSDALDKVIIKPKPGELERTLRLIEKINKNLNKTNTGRKIQKRQLNLFKNFKKIENPTDLSDLGGSQSNDIALAPTNNIFIIQQGDNSTQSTPQTQSGDTILIGGGTFDSFDAEINIRQMEILQTA